MTAKEYLSQAYLLNERIRSKQDQIASLNDLATSCTATLSGMPRAQNKGGSRMADAVCKIVDLENSIAEDMETLVELKAEIIGVIKEVTSIEYQLILEKRYICDKSWPEIAVELGYKMRYLYKLHEQALCEIKIPQKNNTVQ